MKKEIISVIFLKWYNGTILAAVVPLMVLLLLLSASHALTYEQTVLVGLKELHVMTIVESPKPKEIELLGLTKDQIQKDVELSLRTWKRMLPQDNVTVRLFTFSF